MSTAKNKGAGEATPQISKMGAVMPAIRLIAGFCAVLLATVDGKGSGGEIVLFAFVGVIVLVPYSVLKAIAHLASRSYQIRNGHLTISHRTPVLGSGGQRSIPFRRIVSVTVTQGVFGRIFRYGDIHISLPGREVLTLKNIRDPGSVAALLEFR